jgi:hypothetical protein
VAALAAGVIAWRNLQATQARLELDREAQITHRFTQAIWQLGAELKNGKPNLEVRLGGIYALERIARDRRAITGPSWRYSPRTCARTRPAQHQVLQAALQLVVQRATTMPTRIRPWNAPRVRTSRRFWPPLGVEPHPRNRRIPQS